MKSGVRVTTTDPINSQDTPDGGHRRGRRLRVGAWKVAGDLPSSFRYAAQGLAYSIASKRNFRIHVFTGLVVFLMGLWLGLSPERLALLVLTVTAVLVLELLNTATEAVVDLAIGRQFNPLARIAKDCAAAAVLVAALRVTVPVVAAVVAGCTSPRRLCCVRVCSRVCVRAQAIRLVGFKGSSC